MKKLFKVILTNRVTPQYFESKQEAEEVRDRARLDGYSNATVKRGPEHWKGETF